MQKEEEETKTTQFELEDFHIHIRRNKFEFVDSIIVPQIITNAMFYFPIDFFWIQKRPKVRIHYGCLHWYLEWYTLTNCNKVEHNKIWEWSAKLTKGRIFFKNQSTSAGVTCQLAKAMQPRWAVWPMLVSRWIPWKSNDCQLYLSWFSLSMIFPDFVMLKLVAIPKGIDTLPGTIVSLRDTWTPKD